MDGFISSLPLPLASSLSAADVVEAITQWRDLPATTRSRYTAACRFAARFSGASLDTTMMDCAWLNARVFNQPPAAFDMKPRRFADVICDLRAVLIRLGRHAVILRGDDGLLPVWMGLWNQLPDRKHKAGVSGLLHYASERGIGPSDATPDLMTRFEAFVTAQTLHRDIQGYMRLTAYGWRDARKLVPEWPAITLKAASKRAPYSIAVEDFPESFQADIAAFSERLTKGFSGRLFTEIDPDSGNAAGRGRRRRKPARPTTIRTRTVQLRLAASVLVHSGVPISSVRSLRDLVEPLDHAERIFKTFWDKGGEQAGSQIAGIAEVLRQVAQYHCQPPASSAASIAEWAREVTPDRIGLTDRNRKRLTAMVQPPAYGTILNLPRLLMHEALHGDGNLARRAVQAKRAAMIEMLLICPMRRNTLRLIQIDQHLLRLGEGSRAISHIWIGGELTKTAAPIEWPIPPESAALIETWITTFRPALTDGPNPYLFPGEADQPMSDGGFGDTIRTVMSQRAGLDVNCHLFRHFAAYLMLKRQPGCYDLVAKVLGHSSSETTKKFYVGLEHDAAARHFDEQVMQERADTAQEVRKHLRERRSPRPSSDGGR